MEAKRTKEALDKIDSKQARKCTDAFLRTVPDVVLAIEEFYGRQVFKQPLVLGRVENTHLYEDDGDTEAPATQYRLYAVYQLLEAQDREVAHWELWHGKDIASLVFSLEVTRRDRDDRVMAGGLGEAYVEVRTQFSDNGREHRIADMRRQGTVKLSVEEYVETTKRIDAAIDRLQRAKQFAAIEAREARKRI